MSTSSQETNSKKSHIFNVQNLTLDTSKKTVTIKNKSIKLTKKETALLAYLIENKNNILTRKQILKKIWNMPPDIHSRTVDVYIGYLRDKIDHSKSIQIQSIRGLGYLLKAE